MCSPLAAAVGLGLAGSAVSYAQSANLANKNRRAEEDWLNYQRDKRQEEYTRQDEQRQKANQARQDALDPFSQEQQQATQQAESDRFFDYITGKDDRPDSEEQSISDRLLSGNTFKSGEYVKNRNLASVKEATEEANRRLRGYANIGAYGQSFGGLGRENLNRLAESGNYIDLAGNKRRGSLTAYGAEKNVDPIRYQPGMDIGSMIGGLGGIFGEFA